MKTSILRDLVNFERIRSQCRNYWGIGGNHPPGSILELKNCTFSCVAISAKSVFWKKILDFQFLDPLEGFDS